MKPGTDAWGMIPAFERLGVADLRALDSVAVRGEFEAGERIFEQGRSSERLHFLVSGKVKIVAGRADGHEVILEILGPGDPVGVVAALDGKPYPASAVAHEACRVISFPSPAFLGFLETHPAVAVGLLSGFCLRNRQLTRRLADFPGRTASRIARLLVTLAGRFGVKRGAAVHIPLALSRQEIADLVGTTLETAIRTLSRWGKEGLVRTEADGFSIPDLEALRREIEG